MDACAGSIDILAGYWEGSTGQSPQHYIAIDELAFDSQYVGPPAGFAGGTGAGGSGAGNGGAAGAGAAGHGGAGDGGASLGGAGSGAGSSAGGGSNTGDTDEAAADEGCSCRAAGRPTSAADILGLGLLFALLARRRSER